MVRVGLIAEDESDCAVLKAVIRSAVDGGAVFQMRRARGRGEVLSRWDKLVELIPDADLVVVHVDADGEQMAAEPLRSFAREVRGQKAVPAIAVQATEAWLIGDARAVRQVSGDRKYRPPPNCDSVIDPKRVLKQAVRRGRRRPDYNTRRDNPRLSELATFSELDAVSPSLRAFRREIARALSVRVR